MAAQAVRFEAPGPPHVCRPLVLEATRAAVTPPPTQIRVRVVVGVALGTVRFLALVTPRVAATDILCARHGFEMLRIHAGANPAEMVKLQTVRNRTVPIDVRHAVGEQRLAIALDAAVTIPIRGTTPREA